MRWLLAAVLTLSSSALHAAPTVAFYSDDKSTTLVVACVAKKLSVLIVSADLQRRALLPMHASSVIVDASPPRPITWNGINGAGLQTFDEPMIRSLFNAERVTIDSGTTGELSFQIRGRDIHRVSAVCGPTY